MIWQYGNAYTILNVADRAIASGVDGITNKLHPINKVLTLLHLILLEYQLQHARKALLILYLLY
ncbi:hypothetical protein RINTHM_4830 [Richelia intracellularis HM01]|nr:hypothetical protein [Richelia intracellularis]CCH64951.1 hypothetical protein RINTHM_4830 [Richelia intracellularis HM01]